jgi:Phosphatidylinositol-4-phosphate 5-Kinase
VIKPLDGGLILKDLNLPEYKVLQDFLSDYYKYVLMNPHTYLTPILGVYTLKLYINGNLTPIYFMLMRNIQSFNMNSLEEDDRAFSFDIKGELSGKKIL